MGRTLDREVDGLTANRRIILAIFDGQHDGMICAELREHVINGCPHCTINEYEPTSQRSASHDDTKAEN